MRPRSRPLRSSVAVIVILGLAAASSGAVSGAAAPGAGTVSARQPLPPSSVLALQTPAPTGRIVVKLRTESGLTVTTSGLAARAALPGGAKAAAQATAAAGRLEALLAQVAPGAALERRFSRPAADLDAERARGEARGLAPLPDLNLYAQLTPRGGRADRAALIAIVKALLADPAVETAFLEPNAVPAALGFDAFTGATPPPPAPIAAPAAAGKSAPSPTTTPDFSSLQGYLGAPPDGVNALAVNGVAGARGGTVKVMDVEGAWLWTHEDLTAPFATAGTPIADAGWRYHGTGVMGEIRGTDNGFGVRGIAPDCSVGGSSIGTQSTADAISSATGLLAAGDVILIELHAPGPLANGSGQYGYLPMEYWLDNFDAIRVATAAGEIVCEAAGNGQQDLDQAVYLGLFDRSVRDSGAIMCGASDGSTLWPAWFSNNGTRVDLHGWGTSVVTCSYGNLQGAPLPEEQWYTNTFNGTSSASPIVVGSVVALQGMVKAQYGFPLDARLARDILRQTGTPQVGIQLIGPRANLVAAQALAASGIGRVAGTVTDAGSAAPLASVDVGVVETGAFDVTTPAGAYGFPLLTGSYNLTFSSFFYQTLTAPVTVSTGALSPLNAALTALPQATIAGRVNGPTYDYLGGVRVTPLGVPLTGATSGPDGRFSIPGAPIGKTYSLLFDDKPGFGADFQTVTVSVPGGDTPVYQEMPVVTQAFESDGGGFTASRPSSPLWTWGVPSRAGGPPAAFDGTHCWAVGMTADYPDTQRAYLTSPPYDYSSAKTLFASFHYWCSTESGFDGAQLQVLADTTWTTVMPLSGYTDLSLAGLNYGPGWSGDSGGWRGAVFDLTAWRGPALQLRLFFGSDEGVVVHGFWFDGLTFDTGNLVTAVPGGNPPPAPAGPTLAAFPNPFNPSVTIAWRDAAPGALSVEVFDLRGRLVRSLRAEQGAAAGAVTWDGRDGAGRASASGADLLRLRDAAGRTATRMVTLAK